MKCIHLTFHSSLKNHNPRLGSQDFDRSKQPRRLVWTYQVGEPVDHLITAKTVVGYTTHRVACDRRRERVVYILNSDRSDGDNKGTHR